MSNILKEKHAVVFGAGGSIGRAVAKEFALEEAEVFLAGRALSPFPAFCLKRACIILHHMV
jgi:NAD(P)-dependent dehydrogenase (short-subunit alcohol dehydrogenase family)